MDKELFYIKTFINKIDTKTVELLKINLYGAISYLILSKEIFKKNKDISLFLNIIDISVKDYVMKSRTLLLSRIIRELEKMDIEQLKEVYKKTLNYIFTLDEPESMKVKNRKKNSIDSVLKQFSRGSQK
ncbi:MULTISPECIES: hypothetical protein [Enterococcus]|uniref:hypothetical protein n=1 Tax=Enterococcus TaxID=1350 RepID=UPI0002A1E854|nr:MULTISPECIES: hypothetical protein [Enterococcus]ELA81985.1 hypothetical protein OGW_03462 [Enterococcus faecium EnGen0004]MBE9889459.1 hypothetical protein [Enterococcus faecium]HAR1317379.1 hypothetical protein [Enterococcus faecium]